MISFSTDNIRPQDRFDHWREERSKALFGVSIDLNPSGAPPSKDIFRR
jgi:hypothetical protein